MLLTIISTASWREAQTGPSQWNGKMCPPVVCEAWSPLAHLWVGLTLRLGGWGDWPRPLCRSCRVGADPMKQSLSQQSQTPVENSLWICHLSRKLGGVLLWSTVSHLVCWFWGLSGETLVRVNVRDAAGGRLGATCEELHSDRWLVTACAGTVCTFEWPRCEPRLAFTSTKPRAGQKKALGTPDSPAPTCCGPIRLGPWQSLRRYEDCVGQGVRELLGRGKWESSSYYRFKIYANFAEAAQQKSQAGRWAGLELLEDCLPGRQQAWPWWWARSCSSCPEWSAARSGSHRLGGGRFC